MKKIKIFILSGLVLLSSTVFLAFKYDDRLFEIAKNIEIFIDVFKEVNGLYVDEVNPTQVMESGIKSMLENLDPYTVFYPEDMIEEYFIMNAGTYNGIGADFEVHNGKHIVSLVYEGSPADEKGILVGDEVLKIDGVDITDKNQGEFGRLLKGQKGTTVNLSVLKYGSKRAQAVNVVRGDVKVDNVPHFGMVNDKVGYVQLTSFMDARSGPEIRKIIGDLKGEGMENLILDFRGNPGGLLQLAVEISGFFVPKGTQIVEMKGRAAGQSQKFNTSRDPIDMQMPLVVLIDEKSASASEIVSGSLQDLDRAVVVGQRTFGKGLVQITRNLKYNTQVKVTTAKYYIPSGRCVQALDYGHRNPDGTFPRLPDSLRTAFQTKGGRLVYDGTGIDPDIETGEYESNEFLKALESEHFIFNYATKYFNENKNNVPEAGFYLKDQEFGDFKKWFASQKMQYRTPEQAALEELKTHAINPGSIKSQISQIEKETDRNFNQLVEINEKEIRALLEMEILRRYHYQKAMKFASFDRDQDIQTALDLFSNPAKYNAILSKK